MYSILCYINQCHTFLRKGYGPEYIAITTWHLDRLKEVPDLYLWSYYFSYFAFNVNKNMQTLYLLLWMFFDVNYIYLQMHHHHVDMLCCYKTFTTNMPSNMFNCCVYRAAADTLNDFTWTPTRFILMLLLIGLTFLTHPPNKRKTYLKPWPCPKWHPKPSRSSSESALSWCNAALTVG